MKNSPKIDGDPGYKKKFGYRTTLPSGKDGYYINVDNFSRKVPYEKIRENLDLFYV
jgi:hypothetical protein